MQIPNDYDFTVGFVFEFDKNKYFLSQNLDNIYNTKSLDFKGFYKEFYGIWENTVFNSQIIVNEYIKFLGFVNYSDLKNINTLGIDMFSDYKNQEITPLFIEGMKYCLFDSFLNQIYSFKLDKKYGLLGKTTVLLPILDELTFTIYPSKPFGEKYILNMIVELSKTFPNIEFGNKSVYDGIVAKGKGIDLDILLNQLILFSEIKTRTIKVTKKNYKKYLLELQDVILTMNGGDLELLFCDNQSVTITKQYFDYNILSNSQVLFMLEFIYNLSKSDLLLKTINKYKEIGVKSVGFINPDLKVLSYQPTYFIYKHYISLLNNDELVLNQNGVSSKIVVGDFTYIFELYSLKYFYDFLLSIGVSFYSPIESLYSSLFRRIEKYDEGHYNGVLVGIINGKSVKLCFGDKYVHSKLKTYKLFDNSRNLSFLSKNLGGVDVNGLTPDITLKIGDKLFLGDVKFSSFKSFDSNVFFPNPLIYKKLKRYRKIFIKKEMKDTPIFIFYPCILTDTNMESFNLLFDYTLYSHNLVLFPIGIENKFKCDVYSKITKLLYSVL